MCSITYDTIIENLRISSNFASVLAKNCFAYLTMGIFYALLVALSKKDKAVTLCGTHCYNVCGSWRN